MVPDTRAPVRADRLRPLNVPRSIDVTLDDLDRPIAVITAQGIKAVEGIVETWRINDEWWRNHISRRYVEVAYEGGGHMVLFEDQLTDRWFEQTP